ncbi:MAG: putative small integral membrane protein [Glaciecola sp.]
MKALAGALCAIGALKMSSEHNNDLNAFNRAKSITITGCLIAIIMLFGGFIVVAEGWFELWRSEALRAPSSNRLFAMAA